MEWNNVKYKLPSENSIVMTYGYGAGDTEYCQAYFKYIDGKPCWQELDFSGDFFDFQPTYWSLLTPPK